MICGIEMLLFLSNDPKFLSIIFFTNSFCLSSSLRITQGLLPIQPQADSLSETEVFFTCSFKADTGIAENQSIRSWVPPLAYVQVHAD